MHELAGGDRWAAAVTAELIRRDERERAWIAELRTLAAEPKATGEPDGAANAEGTEGGSVHRHAAATGDGPSRSQARSPHAGAVAVGAAAWRRGTRLPWRGEVMRALTIVNDIVNY